MLLGGRRGRLAALALLFLAGYGLLPGPKSLVRRRYFVLRAAVLLRAGRFAAAVVLRAVVRFAAAALRTAGFLAVVFLAGFFAAAVFLLAAGFLAAGFLAAVFFAAAFLVVGMNPPFLLIASCDL